MLGKRPFLSIIAFFSAFILRHETPNVPSKSAKTQMLATVFFFLDCFGAVEKQQSTPAVGNLCWVCSGISKLAEEQGPPLRADVMNSSRECFTFLFLAVVRSFPENQGKKHSGIIFWSIWEQRVEGAKELRLKTHGVFFIFYRVSVALAPRLPLLRLIRGDRTGSATQPVYMLTITLLHFLQEH